MVKQAAWKQRNLEGGLVMMRKVLALMLVLGMTSAASAGIIDVVTDGVGDAGHAGTSTDPLDLGETIAIKIVLNADPDPTWYYGSGYTGYDGYWLSSMSLDLEVSGPATLAELGTKVTQKMKHHASFSPWAEPEPAVVDNAIAYMAGVAASDGIQGPADLVWNLIITCTGAGPVVVDLTLYGLSEYSEGPSTWGSPWIEMTEGDLGDLIIHQVPEPMTIALLGLGGLFLRRRR
jgi:hypothetical protein